MKISSQPKRIFAVIAISASLMSAITASAWAAGAGPTAEQKQQWAQKHQERIAARLAKAAQTLAINTSQQSAWDAYAAALQASFPAPGAKPDGDAASIARARADRASDHAKKLAAVSEATTALQAVLTTEQRKTFDQFVRRAGHRGHHGPRGSHERHPQSDQK